MAPRSNCTYSNLFNPFKTAVPFWGTNYLEIEWFDLKAGTAVLTGSIGQVALIHQVGITVV